LTKSKASFTFGKIDFNKVICLSLAVQSQNEKWQNLQKIESHQHIILSDYYLSGDE